MPDRVLFITSNGTGLGHLTRSMAIARRLEPGLEPLILTFSGAAPVVAAQGFDVEYVASYATPTAGSDWRWSRRARTRLRAAIREADAKVMVFDGAHPYQALLDAMPSNPEMHRVWCRRPMWRPGANPGAIERERFFDRVLEPGEFAADEDRGATVPRRGRAECVAPIVFCEDSELLPRAEAERELGLEPGRTNVLIQLGQGPQVQGAVERCLAHLAGNADVQIAALSSALDALPHPPAGVVQLRSTYPMSRYLRAFDVAVSAAGYNAFHELVRFAVPSLFVPMPRQTDDQAARARYVERMGAGRGVEGPDSPEIERALDALIDPQAREAAAARLAALRPANGAGPAADWIADLAATERKRKPGTSRWRRYARHPIAEGREAAPFVARIPAAVVNIAKQTVQRPSAKALVLVGGLGPAELGDELPRLLERAAVKPERVLVVGSDPELLPLARAAGTGAELIPPEGSAQARASGQPYREFAATRLRAILSERPRVRTVLASGDQARAQAHAAGLEPVS